MGKKALVKELGNSVRSERAAKSEREGRKISQAQVARDVKVLPQAIHEIETGKSLPSVLLALRIADYFEKKVEDIFWDKKKKRR